MEDGEYVICKTEGIYNRDKTNHTVTSNFVLIKQIEYENRKYDWIFFYQHKTVASYVKRYKEKMVDRDYLSHYR